MPDAPGNLCSSSLNHSAELERLSDGPPDVADPETLPSRHPEQVRTESLQLTASEDVGSMLPQTEGSRSSTSSAPHPAGQTPLPTAMPQSAAANTFQGPDSQDAQPNTGHPSPEHTRESATLSSATAQIDRLPAGDNPATQTAEGGALVSIAAPKPAPGKVLGGILDTTQTGVRSSTASETAASAALPDTVPAKTIDSLLSITPATATPDLLYSSIAQPPATARPDLCYSSTAQPPATATPELLYSSTAQAPVTARPDLLSSSTAQPPVTATPDLWNSSTAQTESASDTLLNNSAQRAPGSPYGMGAPSVATPPAANSLSIRARLVDLPLATLLGSTVQAVTPDTATQALQIADTAAHGSPIQAVDFSGSTSPSSTPGVGQIEAGAGAAALQLGQTTSRNTFVDVCDHETQVGPLLISCMASQNVLFFRKAFTFMFLRLVNSLCQAIRVLHLSVS